MKVLTGQGADIDTTTAIGKMVFGVFAALAEFETGLMREQTIAGLEAALSLLNSSLKGEEGFLEPFVNAELFLL